MREQAKIKVLMIGPDRSVHGGISGVVNNYYEAGLDQKIDLCYIGTMVEGTKLHKLLKAAGAYFKFLAVIKNTILYMSIWHRIPAITENLFLSRQQKGLGKKS